MDGPKVEDYIIGVGPPPCGKTKKGHGKNEHFRDDKLQMKREKKETRVRSATLRGSSAEIAF